MNIQQLLFTEKYRPKNLDELILPEFVKRKLVGGVIQNMLFVGSPGTGKCLIGETKIKIRNKKTNIETEISLEEFHNLFSNPRETNDI